MALGLYNRDVIVRKRQTGRFDYAGCRAKSWAAVAPNAPISPMIARIVLSLTLMLGLAFIFGGCSNDDVGTCCEVIDPSKMDLIPVPPEADMSGEVADVIRQDPAFDCSGLTCTAYQGSKAFCTRQCFGADDCPDGFECRTVLQSDPGPGSTLTKDDRFCVRAPHDCETYDP